MKKTGKTTRVFWLATALAAPLVIALLVASVVLFRQMRQEQLDYALVQAAKKLDAPKVERLLREGANANTLDTDDPPPTLQTLWRRLLARLQGKPVPQRADAKPILYRLLFDHSFNVSAYSEPDGRSRLDATAAAVITHGADIHISAVNGTTPLMSAAVWDLPRSVRALIARKADMNARNQSGDTALLVADGDILRELVLAGADVNAADKYGRSVLILHVNNWEDVGFLIHHGADVKHTNVDGLSDLYCLYEYGHSWAVSDKDFHALVNFLKQHGARLNAKDRAELRHNSVPIP